MILCYCILRKTTHRSLGLIVPVFWVVPWSSQFLPLPVAPFSTLSWIDQQVFLWQWLISVFDPHPQSLPSTARNLTRLQGFSYHFAMELHCASIALWAVYNILQPEDWFLCPPHSPQRKSCSMGVAHFWEKKNKTWRFGYQIISSIVNLVVNSFHIVTILMFLHISKLPSWQTWQL